MSSVMHKDCLILIDERGLRTPLVNIEVEKLRNALNDFLDEEEEVSLEEALRRSRWDELTDGLKAIGDDVPRRAVLRIMEDCFSEEQTEQVQAVLDGETKEVGDMGTEDRMRLISRLLEGITAEDAGKAIADGIHFKEWGANLVKNIVLHMQEE